jgi:hypothetical protein
MPSIFDKIKGSLGIKKKIKGQGNVLGGVSSSGSTSDNQPTNNLYGVTFTEESLGLKISPSLTSDNVIRPCISGVIPNTEASRAGIQCGDIVVTMEGNEVHSYDDFVSIVSAIPRPVTLKFFRPQLKTTNTTSSSNTIKSIFKSTPTPTISLEEKEARRLAMIKAAKDRESAWDRKISSGRKNKTNFDVNSKDKPCYDHSVAADINNPETAHRVEMAKKAEENTVKSMGYDPFRPHMSFSSGSTESSNKSLSPTSSLHFASNNEKTIKEDAVNEINDIDINYEEDHPNVVAVDEALSLLLSSGNDTEELAEKLKTALSTIIKMLSSLAKNRLDPKYCSIRMNNKAFQSKVVSISGGVELMIAAGFLLQDEAVDNANETFLKHDMALENQGKLDYTLSRLEELV